jgi:uridylate kinase
MTFVVLIAVTIKSTVFRDISSNLANVYSSTLKKEADAANYRPITLVHIFSKVLEKVIDRQ